MQAMSTSLGARLPARLVARLALEADAGDDQAVLLATLDPAGQPHPALLTPADILALGPAALRLAVAAGSRTADNLRQRGALTLCFLLPGSAHYVKARATELEGGLPDHPRLAAFQAQVQDVLEDHPLPATEGHAELVSGITFRKPAPAGPPVRRSLEQL